MRLLRRKRPPLRSSMVVFVRGYCTECGRELEKIHGTYVGHVEGMCPDHGHIEDALTA